MGCGSSTAVRPGDAPEDRNLAIAKSSGKANAQVKDKCVKIGKWADSQEVMLKGLVQQPKNVGTATKNQTTAQKMRPEFYKKKKELDEMVVTEGNELTKEAETVLTKLLEKTQAKLVALDKTLNSSMPIVDDFVQQQEFATEVLKTVVEIKKGQADMQKWLKTAAAFTGKKHSVGSSAHEQKLLDQAVKLQAVHPTKKEALVALKAQADTITGSKYESKLSSWKCDDCKAIEKLNETLDETLATTATALEEKVVHLTEVFNEAKALEEAKEGQKVAEKVAKQSDAIVGKVTKLEVYATEQLSAFNTLNIKSVSDAKKKLSQHEKTSKQRVKNDITLESIKIEAMLLPEDSMPAFEAASEKARAASASLEKYLELKKPILEDHLAREDFIKAVMETVKQHTKSIADLKKWLASCNDFVHKLHKGSSKQLNDALRLLAVKIADRPNKLIDLDAVIKVGVEIAGFAYIAAVPENSNWTYDGVAAFKETEASLKAALEDIEPVLAERKQSELTAAYRAAMKSEEKAAQDKADKKAEKAAKKSLSKSGSALISPVQSPAPEASYSTSSAPPETPPPYDAAGSPEKD